MIKGVFFDIDDTLYDSTTLTTMARRNSIQAMMDVGLPVENEEAAYTLLTEIIGRFGPNYSKHYDELLKELGVDWDPKIIASGVVAYEKTKVGYLKPYPKVVPTLLALKEDHKLGVVSNGLAVKQWEKLLGLGLHHFFDAVTTSEEVDSEKPEEEVFKAAMDALKLSPDECAMVGDRLDTDILGAKRLGILAIRLKRGKFGIKKPPSEEYEPDYEIESISEILGILKGGR